MIKGSGLQPALPASVSYGRKAKCPIWDRWGNPWAWSSVIDAITDFSCLPFFYHFVISQLLKTKKRKPQWLSGITETESTSPEDRRAVLTLPTLPCSQDWVAMALPFSSPSQVSSTQLHPVVIGCYGLNCVPQNLYVEALITALPNMTAFGVRAYQEVIKVNWGHKGGS